AFAARSAGFDPGDQRLDLVARERLVVLELADERIRIPRRHAIGADRLTDHAGELLHLFIVVEPEGRDAAFLVAGDALLFDDRRDLVGVGDPGVRGLRSRRTAREGDRRRVERYRFHRHLLAVDEVFDRVGGDRTAIDDIHRLRRDHESLADARGAD